MHCVQSLSSVGPFASPWTAAARPACPSPAPGVLLEEVTGSPAIEPPGGRPANWRTIILEKFLHWCEGSKPHNRYPNLGIRQRAWESPGNRTVKVSGIWLQNFHRQGNRDSWRAQTKPSVHRDPRERTSDPTRGWARLACEFCSLFTPNTLSSPWALVLMQISCFFYPSCLFGVISHKEIWMTFGWTPRLLEIVLRLYQPQEQSQTVQLAKKLSVRSEEPVCHRWADSCETLLPRGSWHSTSLTDLPK